MEAFFFEISLSENFIFGSLARAFFFQRWPKIFSRYLASAQNIFAMFVKNSSSFWESSYKIGYWKFLHGREQKPRHYAISGLVRSYFPKGCAVLEVGCGYASVLPLLPAENLRYTGLDLSAEVIQACGELHQGSNAKFIQTRFECFDGKETFDVVLASEVLYYYPISELPSVIRKLLSLLGPHGILVVTMNRNPKSWIAWFILSRLANRLEKLAAMNATGSRWTICVFRPFPSVDENVAVDYGKQD